MGPASASDGALVLRELEKKAQILEQIAAGGELSQILDAILRAIESLRPGMLGSILLLNPQHGTLHLGAAPRLPAAYSQAIEGFRIGMGVGSCGTAAYERRLVVVEDIATHPYWASYKHVALQFGLRACWSNPILSRDGDVLGTFAMYYEEVRSPAADDIRLISSAAHLAAIALDHERMESKILRTVGELKRSNEDLEAFAYLASHDLQEPLRAVCLYAELLSRRYADSFPQQARQHLHEILDGTQRMRTLIEALLRFARLSMEPLKNDRVDADTLVRELIRDLNPLLRESSATIECEPLPLVFWDKTALEVVFRNLIVNAVKFRREEPPAVEIRAKDEGSWVRFSVTDNGIGVEPSHREGIFVLFKRCHSGNRYAGTGIGLATCKKLIERTGGRIWCESQVGKGATFHFTVPAFAQAARGLS